MQCERCGAGPAGADLFDTCALCGIRLCDLCMAGGCCGHTPALSGRYSDAANEETGALETAVETDADGREGAG